MRNKSAIFVVILYEIIIETLAIKIIPFSILKESKMFFSFYRNCGEYCFVFGPRCIIGLRYTIGNAIK